MTHAPTHKSRLEEISARLNAATPGPWRVYVAIDARDHTVYGNFKSKPYLLAEIWHNGLRPNEEHGEFAQQQSHNADLIANAPSDITFLLSEVERLQGLLDA